MNYPHYIPALATREFPSWSPEGVRIPAGLTDESWHNDAAPRFTLDTEGVMIWFWVEYADANLREIPGPRYTVYLLLPSEEWPGEWEDAGPAGGTEDLDEAVAIVVAAAYAAARHAGAGDALAMRLAFRRVFDAEWSDEALAERARGIAEAKGLWAEYIADEEVL
jgi:hypothetical protein